LTEPYNHCALCENRVGVLSGIPLYFCNWHYKEHKEAILGNAPWVRFVTNEEKTRRKRGKRRRELGYYELPLLREV
jgi:hypothetical protein